MYSPMEECKFVHCVKDELWAYREKSNRKSVLLFPPLPSRLRYLIHKTTEDLPDLSTFSVGESWCRRVVVCHSELRGEVEDDSNLESNSSLSEEPVSSSGEAVGNIKPKHSIPTRSRRPKRPDKALYVPRAARGRLSSQNSQGPTACHSGSSISSSSDSCSCPESKENGKSDSTTRPGSFSSVADSVLDPSSDSSVPCTQEEKQNLELRLHDGEAVVWDKIQSHFSNMTVKDEEDVDIVANSPLTEDTSTDTDDLTEEIKAHLKEAVPVSIEHVQNDYSCYEMMHFNLDGFRHVIEIYDFPAVLKTDDLLDAFVEYSDGGMKIQWVDNTHALGVFPSESAALRALSICHPLLKTRTLAKGSKKAKGKAIRSAEFIQPVKERPRTDCAVARRMVTRALGKQGRGRVQRY
ncbi:R3H and coiled-coil domain-containing protein 1 isoform X2 [Amphiprion ocellaris]|uniref:R3H and coiled-coil domain-containing protein 1 isoform X2 n=1 Tax=Amphiprion ocellaris TaxID=80972 RepID=UPI000C30987C|nr:R3H and coiled-coil domain-containing protein 1 isoform X2 [Amphiprion ocellaris]